MTADRRVYRMKQDVEVAMLRRIWRALMKLDIKAQRRVVNWLDSRVREAENELPLPAVEMEGEG